MLSDFCGLLLFEALTKNVAITELRIPVPQIISGKYALLKSSEDASIASVTAEMIEPT